MKRYLNYIMAILLEKIEDRMMLRILRKSKRGDTMTADEFLEEIKKWQ